MQGLFSNNDESMCQILTNFCWSFLGENEEKHENSTKSKAIKKKGEKHGSFLKMYVQDKSHFVKQVIVIFL